MDPKIQEVIERLTHTEEKVRWSGVIVLDKLAPKLEGDDLEEVAQAVEEKLTHNDENVRIYAAQALGRLAFRLEGKLAQKAMEALSSRLNDSAVAVCVEAIRALGDVARQLREKAAAPSLKRALKMLLNKLEDNSEPAVTQAVILALGELVYCVDKSHLKNLVRAFLKELQGAEASTRMNAAWALGRAAQRLEDKLASQAVSALESALRSETNPNARYHIEDALRAFRFK